VSAAVNTIFSLVTKMKWRGNLNHDGQLTTLT